jgi:hypothetical protein
MAEFSHNRVLKEPKTGTYSHPPPPKRPVHRGFHPTFFGNPHPAYILFSRAFYQIFRPFFFRTGCVYFLCDWVPNFCKLLIGGGIFVDKPGIFVD